MRELVVTEFVSLDGVMEAPGGEPGYAHSGWVGTLFTPDLGDYKLAEQLAADILLLGRRTYESFYGAWPYRDGRMADKINGMTKVVASTTLTDTEWHDTRFISEVPDSVRKLKQGDGGPILVAGSRTLVHALLDASLVDEIHLQVFPLILGSGNRFYPDRPDPLPLELVSSEPLPTGILLQTYRPTA